MSQVLSLSLSFFLSVLMLLSCTAGCAPQAPEVRTPAETSRTLPAEAEVPNAETAAQAAEDPSVNGAMTLCPTASSPYPVAGLYPRCRLLADCVLDELTAAAGAKRLRVWETDTMSGLNWSLVPVTLVEMGYMTNPDEDARLNDPAYQALLVRGIANGVDKYFAQAGE